MKLKHRKVDYYMFFCPGCKYEHTYPIFEDGSQWLFNGDIELPTFTPSLLNATRDKDNNILSVCHLFVTAGKIIYCGDCTHELKGQTIELSNIQ